MLVRLLNTLTIRQPSKLLRSLTTVVHPGREIEENVLERQTQASQGQMPVIKQRPKRTVEPSLGKSAADFLKQTKELEGQLVMPVVAACTAEAYDLDGVVGDLRKAFAISPLNLSDIIHARPATGHDVFVFRNGSFVIWGTEQDLPEASGSMSDLSLQLRSLLKPHESGPVPEDRIEKEDMVWREAQSNGHSGIVSDSILEIFGASTHGVFAKLALSNGLADSVKLAVLEGLMERHIDKVKGIPLALELGKRVPIGRAGTLCLIGELLHFRAALNLDSELLDTPDIYWSQPQLEDLYRTISRSLDTRQRISTLNKKMDYAEKMAELLRSHLNESHMFRLEWAIIVLVGFEVINSVLWWMV